MSGYSVGGGTAPRYATPLTTALSTGRNSFKGIHPSGVPKYRSLVSLKPFRTSATKEPGAHVRTQTCVAEGVAAKNCVCVRRWGSGTREAHSVASKRADRATESVCEVASAASEVDHAIASAACADASATAIDASSTDIVSLGGTRRSKFSIPRKPVNHASRRSSHSTRVAPEDRNIASRGGKIRATRFARRSPSTLSSPAAKDPLPNSSGSAAHRLRHACSHCGWRSQNRVLPLNTNLTTEHNASAASSRAAPGSLVWPPDTESRCLYPSSRRLNWSNASIGVGDGTSLFVLIGTSSFSPPGPFVDTTAGFPKVFIRSALMLFSRRSSTHRGFRGSSSSHSLSSFRRGPTWNTPQRVGHSSKVSLEASASFSRLPRLMHARASAATRAARAAGSSFFVGVFKATGAVYSASLFINTSPAPFRSSVFVSIFGSVFGSANVLGSSSLSAPALRRVNSSGVASCTNSIAHPALPPRMWYARPLSSVAIARWRR
mmetsp:Transcript_2510/g.8761  ORF Transcript_2510/g.8761 Transcript_2510/m.8761 type:complete len:491 (+) Transcript_2510:1634-3106(+)